jgi:hypothetical protein
MEDSARLNLREVMVSVEVGKVRLEMGDVLFEVCMAVYVTFGLRRVRSDGMEHRKEIIREKDQ